MIRFDYSNIGPFVKQHEIDNMSHLVLSCNDMIHKRFGVGCDYTGWVDLPSRYNRDEFKRIKRAATKIRKDTDIFIVVGIGGSYLGARASIEALTHSFAEIASKRIRKGPQIVYAGNNLSSVYMAELLDILEGKDISLNIITKSGNSTETSVAFRVLKVYMEHRYGKLNAKSRIYITTDKSVGVLRKLADDEGYESFEIPSDIGGRYSVLTACGLLPIAVAGIDIQNMLKGAKDAMLLYKNPISIENDAIMYAILRNCLLRKGYNIEMLVTYEPCLHYLTDWWKQLFAESEGKDGRGIFPAGLDNTTDLHSMGQYIQDGHKTIFETVVNIEKPSRSIKLPYVQHDFDELNFLAGMDLDEMNKKAMQGTMLAHVDGRVPNMVISVPELNAYWLGHLFYFFEKACAISGYLLSVNPFDQPGVEAYKQNMFALLGKPGFEKEKELLEERLKKQNH